MLKYIEPRQKFDKAFNLLSTPLNKPLQWNMSNEEIEEYRDALKALDRVAVIDALTDILVIELGKANAHGFLEDLGEFDIVSPEFHSPEEFIYENGLYRRERFCRGYILKIIKMVFETASFFEIDIYKAYMEVMRSNMSKLDDLGRPIINGVTIFDGNNRTNNQISKLGEIIYDESRPKGKVLKSINFSEPVL